MRARLLAALASVGSGDSELVKALLPEWERVARDSSDVRKAEDSGGNALFRKFLSEAVRLTDLAGEDLRGMCFRDLDLRRAEFAGANLSRANLQGTNLSGAHLRGACLAGADLSDARGYVFDDNRIGNIALSPMGGDPWSRLKRQYTVTQGVLCLGMFLFALAPNVLRGATLYWVGQMEERTVRLYDSLVGGGVGQDSLRTGGVMESGETTWRPAELFDRVQFRREPVWRAIAEPPWSAARGANGALAIVYWLSAVLGVSFHALRFRLTSSVLRLAEEERGVGRTPGLGVGGTVGMRIGMGRQLLGRGGYSYGGLAMFHKFVMRPLGVLTALFGLFNVFWWLVLAHVYLPA